MVSKARRETEEVLLDKIREAVRSEIAAFAEKYDVCVEKKALAVVSAERDPREPDERLVQKVRERAKEILGPK